MARGWRTLTAQSPTIRLVLAFHHMWCKKSSIAIKDFGGSQQTPMAFTEFATRKLTRATSKFTHFPRLTRLAAMNIDSLELALPIPRAHWKWLNSGCQSRFESQTFASKSFKFPWTICFPTWNTSFALGGHRMLNMFGRSFSTVSNSISSWFLYRLRASVLSHTIAIRRLRKAFRKSICGSRWLENLPSQFKWFILSDHRNGSTCTTYFTSWKSTIHRLSSYGHRRNPVIGICIM